MLMADRVLAIEELQHQIRVYLALKDVKTCTLVSQQWNRYWGRSLWSQIRLQQHHHTNLSFLPRQGPNIQRLSCEFVTPSIIQSITQSCLTLRSLYLHLDKHSANVSSEALEKLFLGVGSVRLTRVHIRLDVRFVHPMRLQGLGKAKELKELYLDPYCSASSSEAVGYEREEYLRLLHVCAGLESFICGGVFLELRRPKSVQKSRNGERGEDEGLLRVKKGSSSSLVSSSPKGDRCPGGQFTALSRRLSSSSQSSLDFAPTPSKADLALLQSIPRFEGYSLRRLNVQSSPLDVPAFHQLVGLCPLLEELTISRAQGASFTSKTWTILSRLCPRLRMIRLENDELVTQHLPDLGDIILNFPMLESLELIDCGFEQDPDLVALGARLRELKAEHDGKAHPLKRLALTGAMGHSTRILADALTNLEAVSLQSLTVGKTSSLSLFQQRQQREMSAIQVLDWEEPLVNLTVSWTCFETLSLLDFTKVDFPPKTLDKIFPFVARSRNLHSLGIAWTQLLSLYKHPIDPLTNQLISGWTLGIELPYLQKTNFDKSNQQQQQNRSTNNNNNTHLPYNREFALQELQDHVCLCLDDKELKICSLVFKDWN
ncbi:hypothetical protein BGZ88_009363, partial [Linnemannia elongata]